MPEPAMPEPAIPEPSGITPATLARPALLLAGLAAAGWALHTLKLHDFAAHANRIGMGSFVLLGAVACAAGVPRQIIAFAGGYAHGPVLGGLLALAAQLLGCIADLGWSRLVARAWLRRRLHGRIADRLDAWLIRRPFAATLILRLVPVGNNLALNLLAGALGVPVPAFLAASLLGYLPQTLVFALLGAGISLGRPAILAGSLGLFILCLAAGLALMRRAPRPALMRRAPPRLSQPS